MLQIHILAMYLVVTLVYEGLLEVTRWLLVETKTSAETTD